MSYDLWYFLKAVSELQGQFSTLSKNEQSVISLSQKQQSKQESLTRLLQ